MRALPLPLLFEHCCGLLLPLSGVGGGSMFVVEPNTVLWTFHTMHPSTVTSCRL